MIGTPPHILFCTAVNPFRNRSGEEIRTKYIIRSLLELGCRVTLLANKADSIPDVPPAVLNTLLFRESHLRRPRSLGLVPQLFLKNRRFLTASKMSMTDRSPDVVFFDWGHLGQYVNGFRRLGCQVVISTHNV